MATKESLLAERHRCATLRLGKVVQPERELPIKCETDVLVVGGGPAGVAAAVSARRTGASVALIERYGYLGGLFTGGLVLLLQGTYARSEQGDILQPGQGFNAEVIKRLSSLGRRGLTKVAEGVDPVADPEASKYVLSEMVREAGVKAFLHCWGVDAIMEGDKIRGTVFESKSGRQAILAKIVVDASGDGDVFAAAGAECKTYSRHIGLGHRLLGAAEAQGMRTPIANTLWVNMLGEKADGLDIDVLTRLEMDYRKKIWEHVPKLQQSTGNENATLLDIAPQLGVRTTRLLKGVVCLRHGESLKSNAFNDVIGVASGTCSSTRMAYIPYRALVPERMDNLLVAGRCVSMDLKVADLVRLVPACFTTGQAAGVAAALCVNSGRSPRDVDVAKLQETLKGQGAYLG